MAALSRTFPGGGPHPQPPHLCGPPAWSPLGPSPKCGPPPPWGFRGQMWPGKREAGGGERLSAGPARTPRGRWAQGWAVGWALRGGGCKSPAAVAQAGQWARGSRQLL